MRATLRRMGAWSSMMRIFDLGMVSTMYPHEAKRYPTKVGYPKTENRNSFDP
jgi:hypothetical protein